MDSPEETPPYYTGKLDFDNLVLELYHDVLYESAEDSKGEEVPVPTYILTISPEVWGGYQDYQWEKSQEILDQVIAALEAEGFEHEGKSLSSFDLQSNGQKLSVLVPAMPEQIAPIFDIITDTLTKLHVRDTTAETIEMEETGMVLDKGDTAHGLEVWEEVIRTAGNDPTLVDACLHDIVTSGNTPEHKVQLIRAEMANVSEQRLKPSNN